MANQSEKDRVIHSISLPSDMSLATRMLQTNQGKKLSQLVRGALLQTWPDEYAKHLGAKRYQELLMEYADQETEEP